MELEGNRVDVVSKTGSAAPAAVMIDGRNPSEFPELYGFTQALTKPEGKWRVKWPLVAPFVSKSGRIVIAPEDWNVAYALALAGIKPVPESFAVKWSAVPRFVDEFTSAGVKDAAIETTVTLAQGLANTKHTLEVAGGAGTIAALRVYRPTLPAKEAK